MSQTQRGLSVDNISGSEALAAGVPLLDGIFGFFGGRAQGRAFRARANQRLRESVTEAEDRSRAGRARVARGVTIAASSGFTTEGSATDVLARMAQEEQTGADRALYEGLRDARELRYRERLARRRGRNALLGGVFGHVASAATAAATGSG